MDVADLMSKNVVTVRQHETVGHLKSLLNKNSFSALPVIGDEGEPIGIVSSNDLLGDHSDTTPISSIMTEKVYTIPQYNKVEMAARVMRNHRIHHVVVTHDKAVVGIISSFDLLELVEGHRFVMKQAGSSGPKTGKRAKAEAS